ncbi:trypsin-like peptidase domain-containing protein [Actinosynnema sp. NPDC002837]
MDRFTARVLRDGTPVGAGFLVAPDLVLTCAHVVGPGMEVDFPLVGPDRVVAEVVHLDVERDVAGLRPAAAPPDVRPVSLVDLPDVRGRRVRAFGVPHRRPDGVWSTGTVVGRSAQGKLQVEDDRAHGVPMSRGFSGGPVIDVDTGAVIGMTVEVESRPERRTAYALGAAALHESLPELARPQPSPFRGLDAFQPDDAEWFFGRDRLVDDVLARLDGAGLAVVTGQSGAGKSSLVLAGVVPRRPGSVVFRPASGSTPWQAAAAALDVEELTAEGLADAVDRWSGRHGHERVLLVADQVDEALARFPAETPDLLAALLALRGPRRHVVLTVGTRALDALLSDRRLGVLAEHLVLVTTSDDNLREMVERPLDRVGMPVYQEGLVRVLLDDVAHERNPLPLLQFTLTLLWEQQERGVLTHDAYQALGGVPGAVADYAERVWRTIGPEEDVRRLLVQLVSPVEPDRFVRRVLRLDDLADPSSAKALAATRLATSDGRTVELAHETLIRRWDRLRTWAEEDRDFRTWQDELDRDVTRWSRTRERALLPRGSALRRARHELRDREPDFQPAQREFVAAGRRASVRRAFWRVAVVELVVLMLVAVGVIVVRTRAVDAENRAVGAADTLLRRGAYSGDRNGLLLALRAYRTHDSMATRNALHTAYAGLRHAELLLDGVSDAKHVNRSGTRIVTIAEDRRLTSWDVTRVPAVPVGLRESDELGAYEPTWLGDDFVVARAGPRTVVWDARTGEITRRIEGFGNRLVADPTGRWLAAFILADPPSSDYRVVDLAGADPVSVDGRFAGSPGDPGFAGLSDHPRPVAVLDTGELVVVTGAVTTALSPAGSRPLAVPAGARVADVGVSEPVYLECDGQWRARGVLTGALHAAQTTPDCEHEVVFGGDRRWLAVSGEQSVTVLRDGEPTRHAEVPAGFRPVRLLSDEDGGHRVVLIASGSALVLRLPPMTGWERSRYYDHYPYSSGPVLPIPGHRVQVSNSDEVEVWDTGTGELVAARSAVVPARSADRTGSGVWLAASPDHRVLTTSVAGDPTVRVWRLPDLAPLGEFTAPHLSASSSTGVTAVRFLDHRRALVVHNDAVSVWDLPDRRQVAGPYRLDGNVFDGSDFSLVHNPVRDELMVEVPGSEERWRRYRLADGAYLSDADIAPGSLDFADGSFARPAIDPGGRYLALYWGQGVEVWDLDTRARVDRLPLTDQRFNVVGLRFGADADEVLVELSPDFTGPGLLTRRWQRNRFWGVPAWFGQDASSVEVVAEEPPWVAELCRLVRNGPAEVEPGALPEAAWHGPVCP